MEKGKEKETDDGLFMERLEMLYEQGLGDLVRGFAERENRPIEEVKRHMSELHYKSLFDSSASRSSTDRTTLIRQVLQAVSQQLESLEKIAGLQSFFLVVNPIDQSDQGFLGGTVAGREFWRGHRGCGAAGAQSFKARCLRAAQPQPVPCATPTSAPTTTLAPPARSLPKKRVARALKPELYGAMREALRAVSGVRNAEMKWTNHSKLQAYGVRLVGWPPGVPLQNPSTLSVSQNQSVLDHLKERKMYFARIDGAHTPAYGTSEDAEPQKAEDMIFEDSIDYSWMPQETHGSLPPATPLQCIPIKSL